jgi:hypothetical protein
MTPTAIAIEWFDTSQNPRLQMMRCWECHQLVGIGRMAIIRQCDKSEIVNKLLCEKCGERAERESVTSFPDSSVS